MEKAILKSFHKNISVCFYPFLFSLCSIRYLFPSSLLSCQWSVLTPAIHSPFQIPSLIPHSLVQSLIFLLHWDHFCQSFSKTFAVLLFPQLSILVLWSLAATSNTASYTQLESLCFLHFSCLQSRKNPLWIHHVLLSFCCHLSVANTNIISTSTLTH